MINTLRCSVYPLVSCVILDIHSELETFVYWRTYTGREKTQRSEDLRFNLWGNHFMIVNAIDP